MLPKLWYFFTHFLHDAAYFDLVWDRIVTKVRGLVMAAGASLAVYGDQITASLPPEWAPRAKLGGVILMAAALMFRAGDKTPANVKALADSITPTEVTPVPPRGMVQTWVLILVSVLCLVGVALLWNLHARHYSAALQAAEAAKLQLAGHLVADVESKATMQATVDTLTAENAKLKELYEKARADTPGSKVEGVAQLSTGSVRAHGIARSTGTPLPEPAPAGDAARAISNPPPEPGGHSGEGSPASEGGLKFDQAPFAPGCLLAEGDTAEIRVKLISLKTQQANHMFVGAAEAWRVSPPPASLIVQNTFTAQLSTVEALEVPPEARWSGGALGLCGGAGCALGPQVAYIVPVFSVRVQATLGAAFGAPGAFLVAGLTLRR